MKHNTATSQTTTRLNQHPTAQEMQSPSTFWVNFRDFLIFSLTGTGCWFIVTLIVTALFGGVK